VSRKSLFVILSTTLICLSLALAITAGPAAGDPDSDYRLLVVRTYYDDDKMLDELARWTEPWEVDAEQRFAVVEVNAEGYKRLLAAGFRVEIDHKLTEKLNEPLEMLPGQEGGIPGYPCYRTVEETFLAAEELAAVYPQLTSWIDIGDSWEKTTPGGPDGYDIKVLRLTNESIEVEKPSLYVLGSIHAREYAAAELATRFAEQLLESYDVDPDTTWLLDYHKIHIVLQANPDGRKKAETGLSWRKNTNNSDGCSISTSFGVDLNRNFEFYWNSGGSSGDACDITYHGSAAASEPETQALQDYGWSIFYDQRDDPITSPAPITTTGIFLDLHSYGEVFLWPWGWTAATPPNHSGMLTLARKMGFFNSYDADHRVYAVSGTTKDYFYGEFGVPSYTVEMGVSFFESCANFENDVWPENLPMLTYAAKASRFPYIAPSGPDVIDISLSQSAAAPGEPVALSATINDTRFNSSPGVEPVQDIVAAEYFIDSPPWVTDTIPVSFHLVPVDGSFDSPIEPVEASIDTSGLSNGRHLVFVRGQDADGNWGVISAEYLFIIDPVIAPTIQGQVTAADNGQPLQAIVRAAPFFQTNTDLDGHYEMQVISGTYDLSAESVSGDYAQATITGIQAHDYQSIVQDFSLYPFCPVFHDDIESGNMGWTTESSWTITSEDSNSPIHSWTDSPGSGYPNDQDASLISQPFDLSEYSDITLNYWQLCSTEAGYDYCQVEVSTDGAATWQTLAAFDGLNTQWEKISIEIHGADGSSDVRLRFRLLSDFSVTADGWYVDDISLIGASPNCVAETAPASSFETSTPNPLGATTIFTDTSTGGNLIYEWDFGDGTPISTVTNPTHQYDSAGVYSVSLSITNSLGFDVSFGSVEITESEIFLPLVQSYYMIDLVQFFE